MYKTLREFFGKKIHFVLKNGKEATGVVEVFESSLDSGYDEESISVAGCFGNCLTEIRQSEIKSIEVVV